MAPPARRRAAAAALAAPLVALALLPGLAAAGDEDEHRKVALGYSSGAPSPDNSSSPGSSRAGGAPSRGAAPSPRPTAAPAGAAAAPTPSEVFCPADVKECPDGSFVSRDSANGCEFPACPPQGEQRPRIFCNPHTMPAQLCPGGIACPDCGGKRCACPDADAAPSGAGPQPPEPIAQQPGAGGGPGLPGCRALPNSTVLLPEEAAGPVPQVGGAIPAGTSVEVTCAPGFNGSRSSWNATCQASGEWLTEANCSLLPCPLPADPLGVWRWRGSGHGQILELSCTAGFVQSYAMPYSSFNCSVLGAGDDTTEPPRCVPGCCDGDEEWRAALRTEAAWSLGGLVVAAATALALPSCWGGRSALSEKLAALAQGSGDPDSLFE